MTSNRLLPPPISNADLKVTDISPGIAEWDVTIRFAQTFDGYAEMGGFHACGELANSMAELWAKAQDGSLTSMEKDELDGYINVSHFIAFVQFRARISLKNLGTRSSRELSDLLQSRHRVRDPRA